MDWRKVAMPVGIRLTLSIFGVSRGKAKASDV
jgi:hypothetical protein